MGDVEERMSLSRPLWVAFIGLLLDIVSFVGVSIYVHWDSPRLLHFLADWIPFAITVFLAFFPSAKEMRHWAIRWGWRGGLVTVGLLWSLVLLHREELEEIKDNQDALAISAQIGKAVTNAVAESNTHSDQKFLEMQGKVNDLGTNLQKSFSDQMGKTETDIATTIAKAGKPEPAERPKFTFSLWNDEPNNPFPLDSEALSPETDGSYRVQFAVRNDSNVQAEGIEEWVRVCDLCSFVGEPAGFDKPKGMDARERHRSIRGMNAGVTLVEGNEFHVKTPANLTRFSMVFKITCGTCGQVQITKEYWIIPAATVTQR